MIWSPYASIMAQHLHLHIYFSYRERHGFCFGMPLKYSLWCCHEVQSLLIPSRDADIIGHRMSSIFGREGKSFDSVWLSSTTDGRLLLFGFDLCVFVVCCVQEEVVSFFYFVTDA